MRLLGWLAGVQGGLLLLGAVGMVWAGIPLVRQPDPLRDTLVFLLLYGGLQGLEGLFSRLFPRSFQAAESLHHHLGLALRSQGFGYPHAVGLALLSGLAEEVFFRGLVQGLIGGWPGLMVQAVLFAALHPTPDRRAWAYTAFTLVAGLAFGVAFWASGSLVPGILAHYLHNGRSFYALIERWEGQS